MKKKQSKYIGTNESEKKSQQNKKLKIYMCGLSALGFIAFILGIVALGRFHIENTIFNVLFFSFSTLAVFFSITIPIIIYVSHSIPRIMFSDASYNVNLYDLKEEQIGKGKLFESADDKQMVINIRNKTAQIFYLCLSIPLLAFFILFLCGDENAYGTGEKEFFDNYVFSVLTIVEGGFVIFNILGLCRKRRIILNRRNYTITIPPPFVFLRSNTIPFDQGVMTFRSELIEDSQNKYDYTGTLMLISPYYKRHPVETEFKSKQEGLELLKLMQEYMNNTELPNLKVFDKYRQEK